MNKYILPLIMMKSLSSAEPISPRPDVVIAIELPVVPIRSPSPAPVVENNNNDNNSINGKLKIALVALGTTALTAIGGLISQLIKCNN